MTIGTCLNIHVPKINYTSWKHLLGKLINKECKDVNNANVLDCFAIWHITSDSQMVNEQCFSNKGGGVQMACAYPQRAP